MCFDHMQSSSNSSEIQPTPPYPPKIVSSLSIYIMYIWIIHNVYIYTLFVCVWESVCVLNTYKVPFVLSLYFRMYGLPKDRDELTKDYIVCKKNIHLPAIINCQIALPLCVRILSGLISHNLVFALMTTMSSYAQPAHCIQKTLIPCSHPLCLALISFLRLLPQRSLSLGKKGV